MRFHPFIYISLLLLFMGAYLFVENSRIVTTKLTVPIQNLPSDFKGYKIVHLSDLHNKRFGANQHNIINKIRRLNPDIIFITGDIVDSDKFDLQPALELASALSAEAPVYFVSGNHEIWSGKYPAVAAGLEKHAVILDNKTITVTKGSSFINIIGIADPAAFSSLNSYTEQIRFSKKNGTNLLLSHRPEFFTFYSENGYDLIFSGHAHGGQVRLPFIGGLAAPNQGFFPKYTGGIYQSASSKMVVSRGLGNSIIPLRIFNNPEIVSVTLTN